VAHGPRVLDGVAIRGIRNFALIVATAERFDRQESTGFDLDLEGLGYDFDIRLV
jgi:hypothetical protein